MTYWWQPKPNPQPLTPPSKELLPPLEERVLELLRQREIPKGELADQVGLKYAELDPILKRLCRLGKADFIFLPIDSLPVIHYYATAREGNE